MENMKKHKTRSLFLICGLLFLGLIIFIDKIREFLYDKFDVYSRCANDTVDDLQLPYSYNCDVGGFTRIDDVLFGVMALVFFIVIASGLVLLFRSISLLWSRRK